MKNSIIFAKEKFKKMKNLLDILSLNMLVALLWADDAEEVRKVGFADTGSG